MMPTAQEVTDTSIRRAAACSMTLHSVCMVVAAKNLKLYPLPSWDRCEEVREVTQPMISV
jgi:hypothetical protein